LTETNKIVQFTFNASLLRIRPHLKYYDFTSFLKRHAEGCENCGRERPLEVCLTWEDTIKMKLRTMRCGSVHWIHLIEKHGNDTSDLVTGWDFLTNERRSASKDILHWFTSKKNAAFESDTVAHAGNPYRCVRPPAMTTFGRACIYSNERS
jgi:hypothetical protein